MSSTPAFDLFRTSEDHEELRVAVRDLVTKKVTPHAAEVDDTAVYPQAAHEALVAADFHAPHVPEAYDGVGADALASSPATVSPSDCRSGTPAATPPR
jgi:alkylation response protein AidB-like acyl-CoA dehydrogenase